MFARRSILKQEIEAIFARWKRVAKELQKENKAMVATNAIDGIREEVCAAIDSYETFHGSLKR